MWYFPYKWPPAKNSPIQLQNVLHAADRQYIALSFFSQLLTKHVIQDGVMPEVIGISLAWQGVVATVKKQRLDTKKIIRRNVYMHHCVKTHTHTHAQVVLVNNICEAGNRTPSGSHPILSLLQEVSMHLYSGQIGVTCCFKTYLSVSQGVWYMGNGFKLYWAQLCQSIWQWICFCKYFIHNHFHVRL